MRKWAPVTAMMTPATITSNQRFTRMPGYNHLLMEMRRFKAMMRRSGEVVAVLPSGHTERTRPIAGIDRDDARVGLTRVRHFPMVEGNAVALFAEEP